MATSSVNQTAKFLKNPKWRAEYISRVKHYKAQCEKHYPNDFDFETDCSQLREMVRCEIMVQYLDGKLMNDLDGSAWMLKTLKEYRDALFKYRKSLCITPEMRMRYKKASTNKKSAKDRMKEMMMAADAAKQGAVDHKP